MATKKNDETVMSVELPKIDLGVFTVQIIGDSPLIVHKWSHKAKEEMLGKQMKTEERGNRRKGIETVGFTLGVPGIPVSLSSYTRWGAIRF